MGPTQSKRTLSTNEDATVASHAGEVPGSHRGFDSAPLDFEARRHRNASGGNRLSHSEDSTHMTRSMEVPDSVNQMLQASLGDEPGLNLMSMRRDSRAAELSQDNLKAGKNKLPTVFRWDSGGDEVYVAGTFSNWKRIPLVRSRDHFYTICELAEGEHEYKYIVDGAWRCDEKVETKVSGEHNLNNVIQVKQTDFEVFEALQCDNQQGTTTGHKDTTHRSSGDHQDVHASAQLGSRLGSPPGTYTQDIPSRRALELEPPPPTLPPHLLQVLLNKDTAANYDPNLLPEPNHVMLNHLYALSIRDGVMVLSATHRYRKKYVTTLLYKPIQ